MWHVRGDIHIHGSSEETQRKALEGAERRKKRDRETMEMWEMREAFRSERTTQAASERTRENDVQRRRKAKRWRGNAKRWRKWKVRETLQSKRTTRAASERTRENEERKSTRDLL